MSILKVARMGHPVLRAKARRLEKADLKSAAVQQLIDDMIDTMVEYRGVGLAAPQVHEGLRLFVAAIDPSADESATEDDADPVAIINPEITVVGGDVVDDWEGCLSIPGFREQVRRARRVTVRARNARGEEFEKTGEDLVARAFLHETDHLNGRLYITHISALKRDLMKRKIRKLVKLGEW